MSASEKLKELAEGLAVTRDEWMYQEQLASALPQLVAVVEAASVEPFAFVERESGQEAVAVMLADWRKIQAALTALEEALS